MYILTLFYVHIRKDMFFSMYVFFHGGKSRHLSLFLQLGNYILHACFPLIHMNVKVNSTSTTMLRLMFRTIFPPKMYAQACATQQVLRFFKFIISFMNGEF